MKKIIFALVVLTFLQIAVFPDNPAVEKLPTSNGSEVFKDFSSFNFYLLVPSSSPVEDRKINGLTTSLLKTVGTVIPKTLPIQSPVKETFLNNPFLVYALKEINDVQGSPLCIYQATLSFLAPTVIEKNKEYGRSTLWSSSCYVKIDKKVQLEKTVGETLSALLESFKADYREAHPKGEAMPTIYLLE